MMVVHTDTRPSDTDFHNMSLMKWNIHLANIQTFWTYCEAIARYAEVLEPSQPVHDAGKVHQQTWEDLKTQKDEASYDI